MERRRFRPTFVDVVAHLLKIFGDEVRTRRVMLAPFSFNPTWAEHTCERTDSFKSATMKG